MLSGCSYHLLQCVSADADYLKQRMQALRAQDEDRSSTSTQSPRQQQSRSRDNSSSKSSLYHWCFSLLRTFLEFTCILSLSCWRIAATLTRRHSKELGQSQDFYQGKDRGESKKILMCLFQPIYLESYLFIDKCVFFFRFVLGRACGSRNRCTLFPGMPPAQGAQWGPSSDKPSLEASS